MIEEVIGYIISNSTVALYNNGEIELEGLRTKVNTEKLKEYIDATIDDFHTIKDSLDSILITELKKKEVITFEKQVKKWGILNRKEISKKTT